MSYDVVVVGAGVGGLTVAALLAKRGLSTCVLERQSQVGGCIGRVEFSGLDFEPGMGLYPGWEKGELYDRLFAELTVDAPVVSPIKEDYVVRLSQTEDIQLRKSDAEFAEELRVAFPECAPAAMEFYESVRRVSQGISQNVMRGRLGKSLRRLWSTSTIEKELERAASQTTLTFANTTSSRFQNFIDAQLKAFLHTGIERSSFLSSCRALILPRRNLYSIAGGISTLAERLADALKSAGGSVRLNSPVLRFAYNESGEAIGVDLLSGERVHAKRALISNLTIWDTYGKLIGLSKTPPPIKSALTKTQAQGAYVIYAAVESDARDRLPSPNFLVAAANSNGDENLSGEITVSISPENSDGKCPATIKTGTEVAPWFSFQSSEEDYEQWDQEALEHFWARLHRAVPELGSGIEVIETGNPRTYYDQTRRKLGMVMGAGIGQPGFDVTNELRPPFSNVFMVGDTVCYPNVSEVVECSLRVADQITK